DKLLWYRTTEDIVYKLVSTVFLFSQELRISWSYLKLYICEFTTTTRLFLICFTVCDRLGKRLFISHLWSTLVDFYLELATHTVNDDFQVKLTHTAQDGLACIFICVYTQCRIFFYQFSYCHTHLISIGLRFRLYCYRYYRFRYKHILQ